MPRIILTMTLLIVFTCPTIAAPRPKSHPCPDPELAAIEADLARFPPREYCRKMSLWADEHLKYLAVQWLLQPSHRFELNEYMADITRWRALWWGLYWAKDGGSWVRYRRDVLDNIRAAIGEEAYQCGFLWPPVAAWMLPGQ